MAIIPLGKGKGITWEPTAALLCTKCREPFDPEKAFQAVRLMSEKKVDLDYLPKSPLTEHDYWYLHNACTSIEKILCAMGANIRWYSYDIPWILGFYIDRHGYRTPGTDRHRVLVRRLFAPGVYDRLYEQWRPALGALDTTVHTTEDISTIALAPLTTPGVLPPKIITISPIDSTPGWLARRFAIMQRDGYRCRLCGTAANDGPHVRLEVDHIVARYRGGTDDPGNLWTLCFACNRGKGTKDL